MKKKIILIAVLAVIFGSGAVLFTPRSVLAQTNAPSTDRKILYYTCPMHTSVKSDKPGNCPYCGMGLEPVYADDVVTNNAPSNGTNNVTTNARPYPLTTCVVSWSRHKTRRNTGTHQSTPLFATNNGANQEIKFCCPDVQIKIPERPGPIHENHQGRRSRHPKIT